MKRIMSKEAVIIPDGQGGIRETVYVDVPAMQNEETGEVFLGDDALGMLDHVKAVRMGGHREQALGTCKPARFRNATR